MTFSNFLRAYVFKPLVAGLNRWPALARRRMLVTAIAYLVTFVVCGLWHGDRLHFVVWGAWHGVGLVVNKLWREVMERPEATEWLHLEPASDSVRLHLLHLIAAHHGTHEFGSPVLPKTPEAVALHHVDNIDAKLEMFRKAYESGKELAPGIIERVHPWPVNMVEPLPPVSGLPQIPEPDCFEGSK